MGVLTLAFLKQRVDFDVSLRLESSFSNFEVFRYFLAQTLRQNLLEPDLTEGSAFNFDDLLANPKRVSLYLRNEGQTLDMLKLDPKFDSVRKDCLLEIFRLAAKTGEANLVHGHITPKHLCYQTDTQLPGQYWSLAQPSPSSQGGLPGGFETAINSKKESLRSIQSRMPGDSGLDRDLVQFKKLTESLAMSSFNSLKRDSLTLETGQKQRPGVQLRLIDWSRGTARNCQLFQYQIRNGLRSFLAALDKSPLRVGEGVVDPHFDFYAAVQGMLKRGGLGRNMSKVIKRQREVSAEEDEADWELTRYRSSINNCTWLRARCRGSLELDRPPESGAQPLAESLEPRLSFAEKFNSIFSSKKLPSPHEKPFDKHQKRALRDLVRELKEGAPTKSRRFLGLLSSLQVDCGFLADIEALVYTALESLKLYPRMTSLKDVLGRNPEQPPRENQIRSLGELKTEFSPQAQGFLSGAQVDALVSALALSQTDEFATHEAQVLWYFKLKGEVGSLARMKDPNAESKARDARARFARLKKLLGDLARWKKNEVLEVFGFGNKARVVFLNKLGLPRRETKDPLHLPFQHFQDIYRQLFFNFLLSFLFTGNRPFFHKICVLAALMLPPA